MPVCLAVQQFTGRHTGINISSSLTQMLSDYSIDNSSVSAVITDNAANVDLAKRLGQWSSRHCFGHTLQLAIEDGLKISPAVQAMLKSAKAIVSFYHRSTKGMEKLKELQVQLKLPEHKLVSSCPTRWNSTYYMLHRLLEQKSPVSVMCASPGGPRISLSVYEWSILEELVEILQPLEEATRELSAEKTVSCSKVIPLLNAILCKLRKHIYDDDETQIPETQDNHNVKSKESQEVLAEIIDSCNRRWVNYEDDDIYAVSTLLDPRFKEIPFTSRALNRAKKSLLSLMDEVNSPSATNSTIHISDDEDVQQGNNSPGPAKKNVYGTILKKN